MHIKDRLTIAGLQQQNAQMRGQLEAQMLAITAAVACLDSDIDSPPYGAPNHDHAVPGKWDGDTRHAKGSVCEECAAFDNLRQLAKQETPALTFPLLFDFLTSNDYLERLRAVIAATQQLKDLSLYAVEPIVCAPLTEQQRQAFAKMTLNRQDRIQVVEAPVPAAPETHPDTVLLDGLRKLMGYVQNATDTTVRLFQDDATFSYLVAVGKNSSSHGANLRQAIAAAIKDNPEED